MKDKRMRHPERRIKVRETVIAILERSQIGRIATINKNNFPIIKPVNYLYLDGKIYIHSSRKGEKISDIRRGSLVCFEVDEPISYVQAKGSACKSSYYYRSIIIKGKASFVKDKEKILRILKLMMEKYQPEGGYGVLGKEDIKRFALIEISIDEITDKENLG